MPEVRTGPVRVSGYAIKLRRVINAALRDYYKQKVLNAKEINNIISDLNAKIFNVLVERFEIPKDAIVNVILNYEVENNKFVIKDIKVEVYDLNEILTRNATAEIKKNIGLQ
ncbi:DUF2258 domain-containing protein [Staphylothermus hellenicus]|uniref:DUF2258 domain-containing protein n=1 Tax=Staphylothermus hellenicus (strain DSM 12710 / JCM 10830 / BK20S6-10-b1 / P8) TaxID=591019 RepID=D7DC34_STAHD|nr:DUF2258 domain-containing protein [Staphylothermus hellenicus]ADI31731.1 hypothetical protein Shell_0606 [Staphylothermus hellenicus DSM 12710]